MEARRGDLDLFDSAPKSRSREPSPIRNRRKFDFNFSAESQVPPQLMRAKSLDRDEKLPKPRTHTTDDSEKNLIPVSPKIKTRKSESPSRDDCPSSKTPGSSREASKTSPIAMRSQSTPRVGSGIFFFIRVLLIVCAAPMRPAKGIDSNKVITDKRR